MKNRPLKIALVGSRGIPARYSGFEQFYEQLAVRLVERGHSVTVYNRSHFIKDVKKEYRGVRIVSLPSIPTKHLDTIVHTALSSFHALFQGYDVVYYCIVGNSPLVWIPRIVGAKTLINVDGEDWARDKWSGFAKHYQKWCERVACRCSNVVIADAKGILDRYKKLYNHETIFVPYGANIRRTSGLSTLQKWGLEPNEYIFYVGRFVPENAIDLLVRAFKKTNTNKKLVIVGDAPYADDYRQHLHELAGDDERIVFTGYAFEKAYEELSSHAYIYVQPAGIDGTRPALLDQMGFGNCVLVRNSTVNMEVIGSCGCFFDKERLEDSLKEVIEQLIAQPDRVEAYRGKIRERIENYYNWEWVTAYYEALFYALKQDQAVQSYDKYICSSHEECTTVKGSDYERNIGRINVLGVKVSALNMPLAIEQLLRAVDENRSGYVCVTGVHGVIESQLDEELKQIHNHSLLTVPDGMPTVWMGLEQGLSHVGRVYGPDLMLHMMSRTKAGSTHAHCRHFFYGATEDVLAKMKASISARFPGVNIVGAYAPPFRPLNEQEEQALIALVDEVQPDFFWVGLSTPKQEKFMHAYQDKLACKIMLGVGAAFPIHAGLQKDAPNWIKSSGFHWLYRLCQEPRRLWRRYMQIVPSFILLALLQLLGIRTYEEGESFHD